MLQHLAQEPVGIFLIIMAVILIAPIFSQMFRLPGIVGLLAGGVIIGPHVLGLLNREGSIELLGTVGLIYLMFSAGAEIDLNQFNKVKGKSALFGFLTFLFPQTLGTLLGFALGFDLITSVLLGSMFSSHTLVAFPIITRFGLAKNEAVSVTVGATIITDIAALLVLAAVAGVQGGDITPLFFVQLVVLLIIYTFAILWGVPRLGRLFFRRSHSTTLEFQFVLVVIFVSAFLAELIGMEAIVGAFLAGLAINATIPHHSPVMGRVLFIGESFFIPIFLLSIGMIIDPSAFVTDGQTLIISAGAVITIYVAKYLSSWITARLSGYSHDETMIMWGLSQAQAAATLAVTLVGVQIGLFDDSMVNAAVMTILFTCVTSPLLVEKYSARLANKTEDLTSVKKPVPATFSRILIPVANPATEAHLIQLADILTRASNGVLMPLNVAKIVNGKVSGLQNQQNLLDSDILSNPDSHVQPIRRVDASISQGILSAALEHETSAILMGWSGQSGFEQTMFGRMLDQVIWDANVPVFIGRLTEPINAQQRVVLVIPARSITFSVMESVLQTAHTISLATNDPLVILTDERYEQRINRIINEQQLDARIEIISANVVKEVIDRTQDLDLVLVTTSGSRQRFQSSLGDIPEQIASSISASLLVMHYPADEI
jgi:Kef-type K+ transport system membrane component KefB/nucleotide-binding universal stress UspA family protein